jgi:S-adenosylmethionine:tRNA ribosyltransferase-isomerase
LHFTDQVFEKLRQKNIRHSFVTLHVGAGTFKPVKAETMEGHQMHAEFIEVERSFIEELLQNAHHPIVAVGTTSLRTIESLYWLGVKILLDGGKIDKESAVVNQWDAYELTADASPEKSLKALLGWMEQEGLSKLITKTRMIIAPGYDLKIASGLITNFHQPQSTLLLLVAAIAGKDWRKIYGYALEHDFRFLSYGDGSLLWKY